MRLEKYFKIPRWTCRSIWRRDGFELAIRSPPIVQPLPARRCSRQSWGVPRTYDRPQIPWCVFASRGRQVGLLFANYRKTHGIKPRSMRASTSSPLSHFLNKETTLVGCLGKDTAVRLCSAIGQVDPTAALGRTAANLEDGTAPIFNHPRTSARSTASGILSIDAAIA